MTSPNLGPFGPNAKIKSLSQGLLGPIFSPVQLAKIQLVFLLALFMLISACGLMSKDSEFQTDKLSEKEKKEGDLQGSPMPYKVTIVVEGEAKAGKELKKLMEGASTLLVNKDKAPDSLLGIELRCRTDQETAVKLLQSQCYYEGEAQFSIDENAKPIAVVLTLKPGIRYHLGRADVRYEPKPNVPKSFTVRYRTYGLFETDREELPGPKFPKTLPGVKLGEPIIADDMLNAVEAFPKTFHDKGYPLAKIKDAVYTLNTETKELNADIVVETGPPAYFGELRVHGNKDVTAKYIKSWIPWEKGKDPFDLDQLDDYANDLRHSSLFRSVEAKPVPGELKTNAEGIATLPVDLTVKEAPFRTLSARAYYDTATGAGVELGWEHKNLFHNGEKLSIIAPIATQEQGIKFAFEKPNFYAREQKLYANAVLKHEITQAYELTGASFETGLERRLSKHFWAGGGVFYEGGTIKENMNDEQSFAVYGPKFFIRHDSRNNQLSPTRGSTAKWTVKPFAGSYTESFMGLAQTLGGTFYYAPFKDNDGQKSDKLVLAARAEGGSIIGPKRSELPSTMRYFTGGAGSVRGYVYQSIGPRDKSDDPSGGRSYQLVNLEARYKLTKDVGIVPFIDGGMTYTDPVPQIIGEMNWGAGIGLRYFTPIGPLRFDVATPLNPIEGDPPIQIYISIGQAF